MEKNKDAPPEKIADVCEHERSVPVSVKNPNGITIVRRHNRRIFRKCLKRENIKKIFKQASKKQLNYPSSNDLPFKDDSKYDDLIAFWTDYFNKELNINPPLDPDMIKALIASESGFDADPKGNDIAIGIAQITKETLKIMQDAEGETCDFLFEDIRQKDLRDPDVAIPMLVRWVERKKQTAKAKLKREPTPEEIILEYKGMLRSNTKLKESALDNYRKNYEKLKKN